MKGRDVWAVVSDLHCGSTMALCPSGGIQLDEGGLYIPSRPQKALWDCWVDYWGIVRDTLRPGDRLFVAVNGDLVDGDHHGTCQIVSKNLAVTQHAIALSTLNLAVELNPKAIVVIRGTDAHTGKSAQFEEAVARDLPAIIRHETNGTNTHYHFRCLSEGVLMDFAHHGSVGRQRDTRSNPAKKLALKILTEYAIAGERWPDVVYRSHMHQEADSEDVCPVRAIQTRGWQLQTEFVERIAAGGLPEIGGIIQVNSGGKYDIRKIRYNWSRETPCQMNQFVTLL